MRPILLSLAACMCLSIPACTVAPPVTVSGQQADTARDAIERVVLRQAEAWNRGDIDAFMQGYWQSPDLRFASGGTVTRGYQATLSRYKQRYKTRADMGQLGFTDLETVILSENAAVLHGHWALARAADRPSGLFTLVFRRMDGDWKIISDTTTSAD